MLKKVQPAWVAVAILGLIWVELGGLSSLKELVGDTIYSVSRFFPKGRQEQAAPSSAPTGMDFDNSAVVKLIGELPLDPAQSASAPTLKK